MRDVPVLAGGCFLVAVSLVLFTVPNNIAPGGVSGLATALAHISCIPVSLWSLLLNIPLLLMALWKLDKAKLFKTFAATILLSLFVELLTVLPVYTESRLVAAAYGGALMGLGLGILFIRDLSTGGTDLLALLTRELLPGLSLGRLVLYIDAAVLLIALMIFKDPAAALYSLLSIFIMSGYIDRIIRTKK